MTRKIVIKGYKMNKEGKLVKTQAHLDVSAKIRQRKSKNVRVIRKGQHDHDTLS